MGGRISPHLPPSSSQSKRRMSRAKNWCFTLNNPVQPLAWPWIDQVYGIYQQEVAPDTGTPHFQGYVQFSRAKRLSQLKKLDDRAHWECSYGTPAQASAYCSKLSSRSPDSEPVVFGALEDTSVQGQRKDIEEAYSMVKSAGSAITEEAFADAHTRVWARYPTFIDRVLGLRSGVRRLVTTTLVYGTSHLGKSSWLHENFPDGPEAFWKSSGKWWDGYRGQAVVIMDDFDGSWLSCSELLRILNPFPYRMEVKGGVVKLHATRFYISTNIHPEQWYAEHFKRHPEHLRAVKNRINYVHWYTAAFTAPEIMDGSSFFDPPTWNLFDGYNAAECQLSDNLVSLNIEDA